MKPSVFFDAQMEDDARRRRLHSGDFFILSPSPGTRALTALARQSLEAAFAPHDPRAIHQRLGARQVAAILAELKPKFIHHPECKKLIPAILRENGVDLQKCYFDVPRLRSAYPSDFLRSGIAYAFHPHRDTWYAAPMCQLNWWIPVYPLDPDNAMAFYPKYFDEAVANDSDTYNYYEWNASNRANAARHVETDTRRQPKPQQPLDGQTICFLPPPGGIILFSGAQLHETVPNTTDLARYSIDFRTVHYDDVATRDGARNLDSRSTGTTMRDYLRAADLERLPEHLIRLYDDESGTADKVLVYEHRTDFPANAG